MVHLVYRHGARSPIQFYPTDKIQEKDWPDGGGRLTQKGMNMEYNLGKFLRERYVMNNTFIDRMYLHTQVYIRSSDVERCLQSAESQLAGLYPPSGYQIWNPTILWQPIPVHTVPKDSDVILRPDDIYCPRLKEKWQEKKESKEYKWKVQGHGKLFDLLSNYSGMEVTADNIGEITDTTICERTDGKSVPKWVDRLWNETISVANWFFVDKYRGDDELGRLLGGSFLWEINENMRKVSNNEDLKDLFKMNIFSGHDTSLLALSTALDVDIGVPHFSSCIMVELYYSNDNYFVEMFYRYDQTNNLKKLKLKMCDYSCPLHDFIELTKHRTTRDVTKICESKDHSFLSQRNLICLVITFASVTVILIIVIISCFMRRSKYGKGGQYVTESEYLITDHA